MPVTMTYELFKFSELTDDAKENARDWLRPLVFSDNNDWDFVFADAVRMGALIGIEISNRRGSSEPAIFFSGFSSQGDGACFEGSYRYRKGAMAALRAEIGGESSGDISISLKPACSIPAATVIRDAWP